MKIGFLFLALVLAAPAVRAEALYKCTDAAGAVSIQSSPCPKGSTQVWKRDATPDPGPTPEQLAARVALAEAEAQRAAEQAREAEALRLAEEAKREAEAQRLADEAAGLRPERKSECTLAHDFADAAAAKPWLQLSDFQQRRLREWVIEQCRDPDAPVADEATSL
ncbi:DUF4124 domain-containing protein [Arenimonas daejeonensis]|uniref:DUF4124 domain-containing protein n=1 Tax=Arenimonas daejeonensis TaxID=370777 RepID=UPI0011BE7A58|nr:DUF4124 domain-containing protein [Arenimonas daejeonensis]